MKKYFRKCNLAIRLLTVMVVCFSTNAKAFAINLPSIPDGLYLKIDLPVYEIRNSKEVKSNKSGLAIFNQYGLGGGYVFSPNIEAEFMFSELEYKFEEFKTSTSHSYTEQVAVVDSKQKFSFVNGAGFKSYCSNNPNTHVTAEEICTSTCKDVSTTNNTNKLNTFIASIKIKPFERIEMFTPYFIGGAGIVLSKSKKTEFSKDIEGASSTKKETKLGFELGIGTKIHLVPKIDLEVSAKYFNYGKYALNQNISKKIGGYRLAIGAVYMF